MYRPGEAGSPSPNPNPYGQNAPFRPSDSQFRSPRPLYSSSPRNQQQHGNHNDNGSYNRSGASPGGRMNFSAHHNRSFSPKYTPPYADRATPPYNRGYFNDHRGRGGRGNFSPTYKPRSDSRDHNPGGCSDITMYYKPNMIEDPWRNLHPIPVKKIASSSST